jgi:hypothetical protein
MKKYRIYYDITVDEAFDDIEKEIWEAVDSVAQESLTQEGTLGNTFSILELAPDEKEPKRDGVMRFNVSYNYEMDGKIRNEYYEGLTLKELEDDYEILPEEVDGMDVDEIKEFTKLNLDRIEVERVE